MLTNRQRLTWHDILSSSRIVRIDNRKQP
jgi:hypothetical protein